MHGTQLHSCANCWFNGLQSGSVGLSVGYCTQYKVVLRQPDSTTCARQVRVDLGLASAKAERRYHRQTYRCEHGVQRISDREEVQNGAYVDPNAALVRTDRVGAAVADYAEYGPKIACLARLKETAQQSSQLGFRAELAMLSLSRAYVNHCVTQGRWTSGIHLLWWTRQRLLEDPRPAVAAADFRYQTAVSLARQTELAQWWLLMLRLMFISDIGVHAQGDDNEVAALADLDERAAVATEVPSLAKLATWIRRTGIPEIDRCLPEPRYRELAAELHQD